MFIDNVVGNLLNPGALEAALTKLNATLAGAVAELQALESTGANIIGSTENEAAQLLATILKASTVLDLDADADLGRRRMLLGASVPYRVSLVVCWRACPGAVQPSARF